MQLEFERAFAHKNKQEDKNQGTQAVKKEQAILTGHEVWGTFEGHYRTCSTHEINTK